MITDNPDTNSRPAKSPSSRPMTLRQQVNKLYTEYWHSDIGGQEFQEKMVELCQEIAREARRDELLTVHSNEHEFGLGEASTRMHERIAELTQKPPQPLADMQSDTSPKADSNQVDNSEEA